MARTACETVIWGDRLSAAAAAAADLVASGLVSGSTKDGEAWILAANAMLAEMAAQLEAHLETA